MSTQSLVAALIVLYGLIVFVGLPARRLRAERGAESRTHRASRRGSPPPPIVLALSPLEARALLNSAALARSVLTEGLALRNDPQSTISVAISKVASAIERQEVEA